MWDLIHRPKGGDVVVFFRASFCCNCVPAINRCVVPIITRDALYLFILNGRRRSKDISIRAVCGMRSILASKALRVFVGCNVNYTLFLAFHVSKRGSLRLFSRGSVYIFMRGFRRSIVGFFPSFVFTSLGFRSQFRQGIRLHNCCVVCRCRSFTRR